MTALIFCVAFVAFYVVVLFAALALAARLDERREQALNEFLRQRFNACGCPDNSGVQPVTPQSPSREAAAGAGASLIPSNVVCMCGGLCPSCAIERRRVA